MPAQMSTGRTLLFLAAGAAAALVAQGAQAQQKMALGGPRTADEITAACAKAHAPNQGKIAECIVVTGTQENIQATHQARVESQQARLESQQARARSDQADARTACAQEVGALRADKEHGAVATSILRQIVDKIGMEAAKADPCATRDNIKKGLSERGVKLSSLQQ